MSLQSMATHSLYFWVCFLFIPFNGLGHWTFLLLCLNINFCFCFVMNLHFIISFMLSLLFFCSCWMVFCDKKGNLCNFSWYFSFIQNIHRKVYSTDFVFWFFDFLIIFYLIEYFTLGLLSISFWPIVFYSMCLQWLFTFYHTNISHV